jgi:hypothetical protein
MYESNCSPSWINQKNRTAVSYIDAQKYVPIAGDKRIDPGTFNRRSDRHDSDSVAMDLFSQPGLARGKSSSYALMKRVKLVESGLSIASDIEASDSQSKTV